MNSVANTVVKNRPLVVRRTTITGIAIVLAIAGALVATGLAPNIDSANAQPVVINQPVQLPSFADVVEQVSPAVVAVRVSGESRFSINIPGFDDLPEGSPEERFFREIPDFSDQVPTTSLGSGFFISGDGFIVTNNHVVDDATSFTVILDDGTEFEATLVGTDTMTDLALLKVDADREFTYVRLSETPVRVGDWALAVGNPFGFGGTVTAGIVSGRERRIGNSAYDDFIQIDAAVNQGNSGGPSFNLAGQVIGVNTAIFSPSGGSVGIAFAVPADVVAEVIADLREHGTVLRGWLGVQIQTVTADIAAALGLDEPGGAIVAVPVEGAPAERAGVRTRDVILSINDDLVADSRDLARKVGALDPEIEAVLRIFRDGEEIEITVTLGAMPSDQQVSAAPQRTDEPGVEFGLGLQVSVNRSGEVVIVAMNPEGTAVAAGLRQGDVVMAVDDVTVGDIDDVRLAVEDARESDRDSVLFQVRRRGGVQFLAVPVWRYN